MRKKMSIAEFASERSELLLKNFRESLATQSVISAKKAFSDAADLPAPRFWVSEARAMRVISAMFRGEDPCEGMFPEKREMYQEIFRRVVQIKEVAPGKPLGDIVFEVVNNPAPKSYLSWHRAKQILHKSKKPQCGKIRSLL